MNLRKCPSCKNIVGAESNWCPRCGKSFRAMRIRRIVLWLALLLAVAWVLHHHFTQS